MIFNPIYSFPKDDLRQIIHRRLSVMKEELPFDPKRMHAWAFCRTMLSVAWSVIDFGGLVKAQWEIACAINDIKV